MYAKEGEARGGEMGRAVRNNKNNRDVRPKSTHAESMFRDTKTTGQERRFAFPSVFDIPNPLIPLNTKRRATPADSNVSPVAFLNSRCRQIEGGC